MEMEDFEPFMVNQYHVGKILGIGTFGRVHLATTSSNEKFAMKCLSRSFLKKQREFIRAGAGRPKIKTALDDVRREIAIMKKTNHPNLVKLILAIDDEDEDSLYMVLEYITGGQTMYFNGAEKRYFTSDGGVYPEKRAKELFADVVQGLRYLHTQGIVHRDLKPENLLLTENGELKIADFGIAQKLEEGTMNLSNMRGTYQFMSPEMISEKNYSGFPVDVWAAGVCFFIFVNGDLPFWGDDMDEVFEAALHDNVPKSSLGSPEFNEKILTILEKDPAKRVTLAEIANDPYYNVEKEDVPTLEVTEEEAMNAFTPRLTFAAAVFLKMKAKSWKKQASERSGRRFANQSSDDGEKQIVTSTKDVLLTVVEEVPEQPSKTVAEPKEPKATKPAEVPPTQGCCVVM